MQTEKNKYGLSRYIREPIRQKIRQQAGFGCVICGIAIGTYEHIKPEFNEAKEHDPEKMTYLCWGCHDKVTRKVWSKEKVQKAKEESWCKKNGRPHDAFDIGSSNVVVWLGPNKFVNIPNIFESRGEKLLSIEPPESANLPYRLSGKFYDDEGNLLFEIDRNDFFGEPSVWDIECVGPRIIIRKQRGIIALQLKAFPPTGIIVERANLNYKSIKIVVNSNGFKVINLEQNSSIEAMEGARRNFIGIQEDASFISISDKGALIFGKGFRFEYEKTIKDLAKIYVYNLHDSRMRINSKNFTINDSNDFLNSWLDDYISHHYLILTKKKFD